MNRSFALALLLVLSPMAWADKAPLQLVGQARLKVLFWPVYDSRLYSLDGGYIKGQRPLRLEIEYLRGIERVDLVEHTRKEWRRMQPLSADERRWLQSLARMWPNVNENDVLALVLDDRDRSTFLLNGEPLGSIDEPAFGQRFLDIWLSPETSRPELRLALIGYD